jgi:antitoxin (DNA-binding transcriptional repressor) of toxin-antitoxin stability system
MQAARSSDQQPTRIVGIGELKSQADEIVREVLETGRPIDIVQNGQVAARLSPVPRSESEPGPRPWTEEERAAFWQRMDALSSEIGRVWPKGVSAVDAVREQRRDL